MHAFISTFLQSTQADIDILYVHATPDTRRSFILRFRNEACRSQAFVGSFSVRIGWVHLNYFTSCNPHHAIPRCIFRYIFWHSIWQILWHCIWYKLWHFIWHVFWHSIWQSTSDFIWHTFWHSIRHSIWHIFWHSIWQSIRQQHQEKPAAAPEAASTLTLLASSFSAPGGTNVKICFPGCFFLGGQLPH